MYNTSNNNITSKPILYSTLRDASLSSGKIYVKLLENILEVVRGEGGRV